MVPSPFSVSTTQTKASQWRHMSFMVSQIIGNWTFCSTVWATISEYREKIYLHQIFKLGQSLQSPNVLVPHPTTHHSEQKHACFFVPNSALWDMEHMHCGICEIGLLACAAYNPDSWINSRCHSKSLHCVTRAASVLDGRDDSEGNRKLCMPHNNMPMKWGYMCHKGIIWVYR